MFALEANTSTIAQLRDRRVELACVVTSLSASVGRSSGKEYCKLTVEDFHGTAAAMVFGDVWQETKGLFAEDAPVLIEGQVSANSRDEENPPIFVDSVRLLQSVDVSGGIAVCIELREGDDAHPGEFRSVREVLASSPGDGALYLRWHPEGNGVEPPLLASSSLRVAPSPALLADLRALLGRERVHLIRG